MPDRPAVEQPEADDQLGREERLHLEEALGVDEAVDQVVHVVALGVGRGHQLGGERRDRRGAAS